MATNTSNKIKSDNGKAHGVDVERLVMPIILDHGKQHDVLVPFAMLDERQAYTNHGQTLDCLARRGGLGADEALAIMDKRQWEPMDMEEAVNTLVKRVAASKA